MTSTNPDEITAWEESLGYMSVQRREDADHQHADVTLRISVSHDSEHYVLHVPPNSTFGYVKKVLSQKTGLEAVEQKILFRGLEKVDTEQLETAGVKNDSKIMLIGVPTSKVAAEEQPKMSEEMARALTLIAAIRMDIDSLSERVGALEVALNSGTQIKTEEFDMSAELLMRQLLKLDGIEAEGEARVQRKAEVKRVQKFHEMIDNLKARNANPSKQEDKGMSVTTEWETLENGDGSSNPPPLPSSSTKVTSDWEQFD